MFGKQFNVTYKQTLETGANIRHTKRVSACIRREPPNNMRHLRVATDLTYLVRMRNIFPQMVTH